MLDVDLKELIDELARADENITRNKPTEKVQEEVPDVIEHTVERDNSIRLANPNDDLKRLRA